MHIVLIGGASTIGSTVADTLATADPTLDITLVDPATEAAWAHAVDITHAAFHAAGAPLDGERADSFGTIQAVDIDALPALDPAPDLVIVTAAAPRPDDATDRDARDAELEANRAIVDDVADRLQAIEPVPVLVLTNPIDRITYRLWRRLGWPRKRFLGYSLSETARAAHEIGRQTGAHPCTVTCPVMGEHGEGIVPVFSKLRIDGDPATVTADQRSAVREFVRRVPFEIASRRGANETSRWVTSAGVVRVVRSMIDASSTARSSTGPAGGSRTAVCLSTPLDGEYGFDDGCLSVPVTMTATGVGDILEWELTEEETARLAAAHERVTADLELS